MNAEPGAQSLRHVEELQRRHRTGLLTLVFTDMLDSTALKQELGDRASGVLFEKHHKLVRETLGRFADGQEIGTAGDSFLITFATPSDAVQFALLVQAGDRTLSQESGVAVRDRVGIHVGEVVIRDAKSGDKPADLYGIQVDTCSRVMSLAAAGQILMTRAAFESARQVLKGEQIPGVGPLEWFNHGQYRLKGLDAPEEVCEVRETAQGPATPPRDSEKARRQTASVHDPGQPAATAPQVSLPGARGRPEAKAARHLPASAPQFDLSRLRHELRTPINHILGYCELLMEERQLPDSSAEDLRRIHSGGRELQALIDRHFDEEHFLEPRDLHQLYHELRTPANHIVGYAELLIEQAEDAKLEGPVPDLKKIRDAAANWLALMEAYLVEPLASAAPGQEGTALLEALNQGFSFKVPEPKSASGVFQDQGTILVVDDDESSREMLARRLRRCGYTVSIASNGMQALNLLRQQPFDLVLLDMVMPGLDGFQVLAKLKSQSPLREIPVIMLSALDDEKGIARAIEMGAEDYLAKPFNPVFLRARIGACLERKRLRDKERKTL